MILGNNRLLPAMSVGYSPVCASKPGLWPCYPMVPRFGFGRLGAANPVIPRYGMGQVDTGAIDPSTPVDLSTGTTLPAPVQNIFSAFGSFGWPELLILGGVGYMLWSTFMTTKRGVGAVTGAVKRRRARVRRRREQELEDSGPFFGLL